MEYVITCGDEGVQINEGTRIAIVGAGFRLDGFSEIVTALKQLLGKKIRIAASAENSWVREQLELSTWEQTDAIAQQHIQAVADREKLLYAGFLPFADPEQLEHDIKGHMVRPQGIHIANKICFTIGGGEQTFHLGHFVISAEWVSSVDESLAKDVIQAQIDFYQKLAGGRDLMIELEEEGELADDVKADNKHVLQKLGFISN